VRGGEGIKAGGCMLVGKRNQHTFRSTDRGFKLRRNVLRVRHGLVQAVADFQGSDGLRGKTGKKEVPGG